MTAGRDVIAVVALFPAGYSHAKQPGSCLVGQHRGRRCLRQRTAAAACWILGCLLAAAVRRHIVRHRADPVAAETCAFVSIGGGFCHLAVESPAVGETLAFLT